MKPSFKYRWMLWSFGRCKVPLIGHVKPKLLTLNDEQIMIKIPLLKRNKNHLHSMYFGSLAIGADIAAGFHGLYHAKKSGLNVSLAFKSMEGNFLSRPEADVYFISDMGEAVKAMLADSKTEQKRINRPIEVKAYINYPSEPKEVANFKLELSLKVI